MRRAFLLTAILFLFAPILLAQEIPTDQRTLLLISAKSKYYNLTSAGVRGFSCDVTMDWNSLFRSVSGKDLAIDDPYLLYLQKTRISFTDILTESPKVEWTPTTDAPPAREKAIAQMQNGFQQLLQGFLTSWNPSLNGTLIPMDSQSISKTPNGYLITAKKDGQAGHIILDQDLAVLHIGGTTEQLSSEMDTTFTPSPHGLLLTQMDATVRQPATAPAVNMIMTTTFTSVDGVQIPSNLDIKMQNVTNFKMKFDSCKILHQSS